LHAARHAHGVGHPLRWLPRCRLHRGTSAERTEHDDNDCSRRYGYPNTSSQLSVPPAIPLMHNR
jgi:hypothetical protein